jgi:flavin reductase (DIM6/NTAB) family NADH-FMN oxidoreductase RutF
MNLTSAPLPHGESEFEKFHIASAPSTTVKPPRVAAAPVAFECRLDRVVIIGDDGPLSGNVVFGTVACAHVSESVLTDGAIDPRKLDTIGRMGSDYYTRTTDLFTIQRPK